MDSKTSKWLDLHWSREFTFFKKKIYLESKVREGENRQRTSKQVNSNLLAYSLNGCNGWDWFLTSMAGTQVFGPYSTAFPRHKA